MGVLSEELPLVGMISDEDAKRLVINHLTLKGDEGAHETELAEVINWAAEVKSENLILDMALEGKILVGLNGTNVVFRNPTPQQKATFDDIARRAACPQ